MDSDPAALSVDELAVLREMIAAYADNRQRARRRRAIFSTLSHSGQTGSSVVLTLLQILVIVLLLLHVGTG